MAEESTTRRFQAAAEAAHAAGYRLRLYVAGATPSAQRAISNLTRICERELPGRYTLEVIDIYLRPQLAADEQIVAAPTLLKLLPEPVARLVGDLSDEHAVLVGLDLRPR